MRKTYLSDFRNKMLKTFFKDTTNQKALKIKFINMHNSDEALWEVSNATHSLFILTEDSEITTYANEIEYFEGDAK